MPGNLVSPVYITLTDSVPGPMLWICACVNNVLVTTPICLFSNCSKRLFVVSRQHETSSNGAYAWSLLRNQAQTAKEASREKISAVPVILVAKNYSTTLPDDHCSLHLPRPRPGHCGAPIKMMSLVRHLHLYLTLPAIFAARKCNQTRLLYNFITMLARNRLHWHTSAG